MELSVVASLYCSSRYLQEFYSRITAAAQRLTDEYELILVNDGSPDESLDLAISLSVTDPRVVVVDLSRNFGHHQAIVAGMQQSQGARVFLIDVDLEESPEWLDAFAKVLDSTDVDVVYGTQKARRGSFFKRHSGALFYKLFNSLSDTPIPTNACTVRLMTRRYVDAVLTLRDRSLFLSGNFAWAGFKQHAIQVDKQVRTGQSTYTILRRASLFINALTSFTSYPLHLMFFLGVGISSVAACFGLGLIIKKLLDPPTVQLGWSSLMVSIWLLGGIIISSLGIIGLYIGRLFTELKPRPPYIVRQVIRHPQLPLSESANGDRSKAPVGAPTQDATHGH